jgi:segregation and condensation protein B
VIPNGSGPSPGDQDDAPGGAGQELPGLRACIEAVLLVVDEPVPDLLLAQVLERPRDEVAGGWRLYTREECAAVVERVLTDGQEVRLTQAALEALAVVAYRQPVSRARVSAVRGVNCDAVMRTLTLRGLIEEQSTDPETGAILYRTTDYFLERLGLASLADLPELAPFLPDEVEDEQVADDGP